MIATCVKVGTQYGPEYVNRLASMLYRHAGNRVSNLLCLTDDPTGLECDYADIGTDWPGWWSKLVLFKPHPRLEGHRVVYLDLDTVIVGNVDFLFDYTGDFCILRDFYRPQGYGSAVMSIAPGWGATIWEQFARDSAFIMQALHGDQEWIETIVEGADLWQDLAPGKIGSYKADSLQESPRGFSLCAFHGVPKPHQVDGWVKEAWR